MNTSQKTQTNVLTQPSSTPVMTGLLQRKCGCGGAPGAAGDCNDCANKKLGVQRSANGSASAAPSQSVPDLVKSSGRPLESPTRSLMESRFGHDFGRVRVHTDDRAAASARHINALAYTRGQDIVFDSGQYEPSSPRGQRLLAHELAHVVQQNGSSEFLSHYRVGEFNDPSEHEAELAAEALVENRPMPRLTPITASADRADQWAKLADDLNGAEGAGGVGTDSGAGGGGGAGAVGGGGGGAAGAVPVQVPPGGGACAHPISWTHSTARDFGPNAIQVDITWGSSTGALTDLGSCTVREVVTYDPIPDPPFTGWSPPNPTILTVPGVDGAGQDTHSYPPGLASLAKQVGTATSHQVYQFRCTGPGCSGNWEDFPGQRYTITRQVIAQFARPDPWQYRITKTGVGNPFSYSRQVALP